MDRLIFDNYDVWEDYSEDAIADLRELEGDENYVPSDNAIWEQCDFRSSVAWDAEHDSLNRFFDEDNAKWILVGELGRWDGTHDAGFIFSTFDEMFDKATKDCDYFRLGEEDGQFYLKCSHHDGTNLFYIRKLTDEGERLYDEWDYGDFGGDLSERKIHNKIFNDDRYSVFPNYCSQVYGEIKEQEAEKEPAEPEKEQEHKKKRSRGR